MASGQGGIVVFASGQGSNFSALVSAVPEKIRYLMCNRREAKVCTRAAEARVPFSVIDDRDFASRTEHECAVLETLRRDLPGEAVGAPCCVVLAGYMRVLTGSFLRELHLMWPFCRIINLHPAGLNVYRGPSGYQHAVIHRFPYWRLTVHEVTEVLDSGPEVATCELPVFPWETADELHARMRSHEHRLLARAVRAVCADGEANTCSLSRAATGRDRRKKTVAKGT